MCAPVGQMCEPGGYISTLVGYMCASVGQMYALVGKTIASYLFCIPYIPYIRGQSMHQASGTRSHEYRIYPAIGAISFQLTLPSEPSDRLHVYFHIHLERLPPLQSIACVCALVTAEYAGWQALDVWQESVGVSSRCRIWSGHQFMVCRRYN